MQTHNQSPPCGCAAAGFCARFNRTMSDVQHRACQTNSGGYRDHHAAIMAGLPSPISPSGGLIAPLPLDGPGTELGDLLASLGITDLDGCQCKARVMQMNVWGIKGCHEHFDTIVGWMRESQAQFGWADKLKAAGMAAVTGLAFKVNWADPFPGLIDEAIRRAEAKGESCRRAYALAKAMIRRL